MRITVTRPFFLGDDYCQVDDTIDVDDATGHHLVGMGKARVDADRVTRDDASELDDDAMTTDDASELVPGRRRQRVTR